MGNLTWLRVGNVYTKSYYVEKDKCAPAQIKIQAGITEKTEGCQLLVCYAFMWGGKAGQTKEEEEEEGGRKSEGRRKDGDGSVKLHVE